MLSFYYTENVRYVGIFWCLRWLVSSRLCKVNKGGTGNVFIEFVLASFFVNFIAQEGIFWAKYLAVFPF